ncbi:antibiotic biosynthesis monooxygenase [Sporosarcina sp. GW1-11]|uniref:antibiotic biosynthesis monooxygenase family protein n=1 Tax=Sporosarcina sp. GW1-11 TaxID=2899126 RepID=UPI00294C22F8|nr:antibiotic biosynthesis monooxygenase [Sporosarcina sp. GW1-11]MDV6377017.1 antibiotic biosynthesis monooxygenase [Sporosarcina sp. GW1-11]
MNIYITTGTIDFMEKVKDKYADESMLLMNGGGHTLLLHETNGKSVFQTPRKYEVVGAFGNLTEPGYFALDNVAVTDEGKPIFEHRYKEMGEKLRDIPGFIAFRLLRPIGSDTYIVLTEWTDRRLYDLWRNSPGYKLSNPNDFKDQGGTTLHIFTSAPYTATYKTPTEEV